MKALALKLSVSTLLVLLTISLFAQSVTREQASTFFAEHEEILFESVSMGGRDEGRVESFEFKGNKIVLDVFIKGGPNPNLPPHMQPQDRNEERSIFFENGKYSVEAWDGERIQGELNDYNDRIILSFNYGEGSVNFIVLK